MDGNESAGLNPGRALRGNLGTPYLAGGRFSFPRPFDDLSIRGLSALGSDGTPPPIASGTEPPSGALRPNGGHPKTDRGARHLRSGRLAETWFCRPSTPSRGGLYFNR